MKTKLKFALEIYVFNIERNKADCDFKTQNLHVNYT